MQRILCRQQCADSLLRFAYAVRFYSTLQDNLLSKKFLPSLLRFQFSGSCHKSPRQHKKAAKSAKQILFIVFFAKTDYFKEQKQS